MVSRTQLLAVDSIDFSEAPKFQKISSLPVTSVAFASGGEIIVTKQTKHDGTSFVETVRRAKHGDAIISRTKSDVYVVDRKTFCELYERVGELYISKSSGVAKLVTKDVEIEPPWGGSQAVKAGGVIFRSDQTGEIYGNQAGSFEQDFARLLNTGELVALSEPLVVQLGRAEVSRSTLHIADIKKRQEFYSALTTRE